ncbi:hypothetical protein J437_LFUL015266 [Ladona fulva]|uniref:tRNA N(3)-methylcytidine methyltransferase n=1 Tax=Ladona fulva TaxID=123851 RepID=A0A8K0KV18_LADFU|nr:hypothetical protein J437_LFUL015266 [Ladona fulva]
MTLGVMAEVQNTCSQRRVLTEEELLKLSRQNSLLVSSFNAEKLEREAKRNWDLFYKRNSINFFKDRHWTVREFDELLGNGIQGQHLRLLEIGCGVGNFIFPLFEDGGNFYVYACDISPRAVEYVKLNSKYDEDRMTAFQADATTDDIVKHVPSCSLDIVTLIFVLSSIHPEKHRKVLENAFTVLKPEGVMLFRDYGLYDMAQLRFKPGQKISENFYARQDGTRAYYFDREDFVTLVKSVGFSVISCEYVFRRTTNIKEGLDVRRVFLQAKLSRAK